jgi:hypothetical protein
MNSISTSLIPKALSISEIEMFLGYVSALLRKPFIEACVYIYMYPFFIQINGV